MLSCLVQALLDSLKRVAQVSGLVRTSYWQLLTLILCAAALRRLNFRINADSTDR
jgi:hypothetical protein